MSPVNIPYAHRFSQTRGHGFGGILRSVGNVIRPFFTQTKSLLKPLGRELKKEGLQALTSTAADVLNGAPVKDAFKNNLVKSRKRVVRKIKRKVVGKAKAKAKGKGKRKGGGRAKAKGKGKRKGKGAGKGKKGSGKRKVKKRVSKKKKKSIFDEYSF